MNSQQILGKLKDILPSDSVGRDWDLAIEFLRGIGLSKIESIEMLRKIVSVSYYEAESIVHNSKIWSDVKEVDEKVSNDFFDLLDSLGSSK